MKKNYSIWLWVIALSCFFASCKKEREDTLPPATQTGAGTFGCKINGKVFIAKGSSGTGTPNPHIQYDIDLIGQPYLSIEAKRYEGTNVNGSALLFFLNVNRLGSYLIPSNFKYSVGWSSFISGCGVGNLDTSVTAWGGVITRLDITNRIISGTFDFKALKPGCDTVRVTDGRFDIKF